jgi:hypothetical protein
MLAEEETKPSLAVSAKGAWSSAAYKLDGVIESFRQAAPKQRALYIGAVAVPVVLVSVLLLKPARHDKTPDLPEATQVQTASNTQLAPPASAPSAAASAPSAAPPAKSKATGVQQPVIAAKPDSKKRVTKPKLRLCR